MPLDKDAKKRLKKIKQRVYSRASQRKRRRRAKAIRKALRAALGGHCENPQGNPRCLGTRWLEFDHKHGRLWQPNKLNCLERALKYLEDWAAGRLRLLCRSCNGSDGAARLWKKRKADVAASA